MKAVTKKQLALLIGSSFFIVLLLFANTKLPSKKETDAKSEHANTAHQHDLTGYVKDVLKTLTATQRSDFEKLETSIETAGDKKTVFEQLIAFSDSVRQPVVSAYYAEKAALASSTEKNWETAANRYYMAIRFTKQEDQRMLYEKSIECFKKVLELNPSNVEAKISLAACYVEGSEDPMKGIAMLREIEKTDSNNVNLQLNFAFFSEKSGQWDMAIKRLEKVLKLKPDLIDVYLHLADAYRQKGDKENAIKNLEKYYSLVDDVVIKSEIQEYIKQLKNI